MNRILSLMAVCLSFFIMTANDYIESYNSISDEYQNSIYDIQVIRQINGGTVITPIYDASCPEDIVGPFSYACKIVEEYMLPCLPIKIKVTCGRINSSVTGVISKVRTLTKENFGNGVNYRNATMTTIKGVKSSKTAASEYTRADKLGLRKDHSLYNSYRIGRFGSKPMLGSPFILNRD